MMDPNGGVGIVEQWVTPELLYGMEQQREAEEESDGEGEEAEESVDEQKGAWVIWE